MFEVIFTDLRTIQGGSMKKMCMDLTKHKISRMQQIVMWKTKDDSEGQRFIWRTMHLIQYFGTVFKEHEGRIPVMINNQHSLKIIQSSDMFTFQV